MTMVPVRNGGVGIATYLDGVGPQPCLVLLNSLATDHRLWDDQIARLSRTHRVLRIDTRGHGQSEAPIGPYDFDMLVADVIAAMDAHGIESADVMGLSIGGMIALGLALDQPARVERLIVCDARADAPEAFRRGWDERIAAVQAGGMAAIADGTLQRWFTASCSNDVTNRAREMILATSTNGFIGCAEALKQLDYLRRLNELRCSVLYLRGSEDAAAPNEAMEAMSEQTPFGELRSIPRSAHLPNMESPIEFNNMVAAWLAKPISVAASEER